MGKRLLLLTWIHLWKIIPESYTSFFIETCLKFLSSLLSRINKVFYISRQSLNMLFEVVIKSYRFITISVDLDDLVVTINDDFELFLTFILIFTFTI